MKEPLDDALDELEQSFVNGNISWVVERVSAMRKLHAMYLSAMLMRRFQEHADGGQAFIDALRRRL